MMKTIAFQKTGKRAILGKSCLFRPATCLFLDPFSLTEVVQSECVLAIKKGLLLPSSKDGTIAHILTTVSLQNLEQPSMLLTTPCQTEVTSMMNTMSTEGNIGLLLRSEKKEKTTSLVLFDMATAAQWTALKNIVE